MIDYRLLLLALFTLILPTIVFARGERAGTDRIPTAYGGDIERPDLPDGTTVDAAEFFSKQLRAYDARKP